MLDDHGGRVTVGRRRLNGRALGPKSLFDPFPETAPATSPTAAVVAMFDKASAIFNVPHGRCLRPQKPTADAPGKTP